jgi:hypothetical protein
VLKDLFGRVSVPQAVHEELSREGHFPFEDWINVEKIQNRGLYRVLRLDLGPGESESLCLGVEKKADLILLDDKRHGKQHLCFNFRKPEQLASLSGQRNDVSSVPFGRRSRNLKVISTFEFLLP